MPTTISDDAAWAAGYPAQPGQPTMRERWAKGFAEADFRLYEGKPYAVWPDWDYAECWGPGAAHEAHPLAPYSKGTPISEAEFRALVKVMHRLH